jgi:hypothetical protein
MAWVLGVIATVALLLTNLDSIISFGTKWIGPYLKPRAEISVVLGGDLDFTADVFVAEPTNETQVVAVDQKLRGRQAVLIVPADTIYTIGWQGPGLEAGAAPHILAVRGKSSFRLERTGESQGQIQLSLRKSSPSQEELAVIQPSANLLLSARAAQGIDPFASIATSALPELDRAVAIVGLFETGTTDCARRLFYVMAFGVRQYKAPVVGCIGASIPGGLSNMIIGLDGGDTLHRLDALLGEDAGLIRNYAKDWHAVPPEGPLRQAMQRLVATPEFWIEYETYVLSAYAQATDEARKIGIASERGRLLVFDRLVSGGPGMVRRAISRYVEQYSKGSSGSLTNQTERIRALGELLKAEIPTIFAQSPGAQFARRRIDTIVSGHGTIRGITFDLNRLNVSDAS